MKTVNIDGLELNDNMIGELKGWFKAPVGETTPEVWNTELNDMKNTFIKIMCDENNDMYLEDIKECLRFILVVQQSLEQLIPQQSN